MLLIGLESMGTSVVQFLPLETCVRDTDEEYRVPKYAILLYLEKKHPAQVLRRLGALIYRGLIIGELPQQRQRP
jgi:hypothetical protein